MIHMVDLHSETWSTINELLNSEKERAINCLIGDRDSERQRGKIDLIKKIQSSFDGPKKETPATQNIYS